MSSADLNRLATALEYADLGAALYLAGGSDLSARLLAAAAEQVLGEVVRLADGPLASDDTRTLLESVARAYQPQALLPRPGRRRVGADSLTPPDTLRHQTEAYLRAVWFMLEALGLAELAPDSLAQAVETSTVFSGGAELEPFC